MTIGTDRVIVDPPMLECPHCGCEQFIVGMHAPDQITELRSIRTGGLLDMGRSNRARVAKETDHAACAGCGRRIGTVIGSGAPFHSSEKPARKLIRISTLGLVECGRIMLVRKRGLDMFILPGGKQEPEENDADALRRELWEEIRCRMEEEPELVGVFRDAAGGAPDVDVEVTMHTGKLDGTPTPMAEIEEIRWVSLDRPEVPVAPSLTNLIMPYLLAMERRRRR